MTLRELSYEYKAHADTLSLRMKQLRLAARETEDPERRHRLGGGFWSCVPCCRRPGSSPY